MCRPVPEPKTMSGRPKFNPMMDVLAGTIMAMTSVPQLLSYAETTGYASHVGLTTAGPSLVAWGLATGSPWLNSGVTSITALMTKTDLDGEAYATEHGEEAYIRAVAAYAVVCGLCSLLLVVAGFGKMANYVPKTVKAGFKWGCAIGVLCSALPNGLLSQGKSALKALASSPGAASSPILRLGDLQKALPQLTGLVTVSKVAFLLADPRNWDAETAAIFFFSSLVVMKGKSILPKWCPTGTDVIIATVGATLYCVYTGYDGAIVGEIPTGDREDSSSSFLSGLVSITDPRKILFETIPNEILPRCFSSSYVALFLSASTLAAVNFLSVVGIASAFETENSVLWSADRELGAQGVACLVAGVTGSGPVSGSLSRSLVSRMAGATSQLACIVTALVWILCLPYLTVVEDCPKCALSSVIVSAVVMGICVPKDLLRFRGFDAVVGWGTGVVTMCTSPTVGFASGVMFYVSTEIVKRILGNKESEKKKVA